MKSQLLTVAILALSQAYAADSDVPTKLFGIELGGRYELNDAGEPLGAPIEKIVRVQKWLADGISGINFWFKPDKDYPDFEYLEMDKDLFPTSFRLYLLPVMTGLSDNQMSNFVPEFWEVATIEWRLHVESEDVDAKRAAYYWADGLCESVAADLGMSASDEMDSRDHSWRTCDFIQDGRKLRMSSFAGKVISLSFAAEVFDTKNARLDKLRRKARMEKSRPYE